MRGWMFAVALGCSGGATGKTTGETGTTDPPPTGETGTTPTGETGTVATADQCLYDLGLWCFNRENPPGPSQTTGTCPVVTVAELLTGGTGYFAATQLRCTEATHGTLDVVNHPTGYGGPTWYFDAGGALVAFRYTTDYSLCYLPGSDGASYYGFVPDCADWCEVVDPNDIYSYPSCP